MWLFSHGNSIFHHVFFVIFTKFLPSFCENVHKHRCSLEKIDLFWPVNRDQKVNHLDAALLAKK